MILGVVMILVVAYVMVVSNPPYGDALVHTFAPEHPIKLILPIITLVGGTVGGYITFAGAHRLLDSGMKGKNFTIRQSFCYCWNFDNWYYENFTFLSSVRCSRDWCDIKFR